MDPQTKNIITTNLHYLCQNTTNLSVLLIILQQYRIISEDEKEQIESKTTSYAKNTELYKMLTKKLLAMNQLLEILRQSENETIASFLQAAVSEN